MKKILFFLLLTINTFSLEYLPYQGKFKEIETEHFKIIFAEKHLKIAIIIAEYAEDIHKKILAFLNWKPKDKTLILLTDHTDSPNGLAYTYVRNTIVLYLTHSDLAESLRSYENPLYSLLLHEYTHILHIDRVRGPALFWQIFYGRSLYPNSLIFSFLIEGLAVFCESKFSAGGRLSSTYNIAVIKEAILNNKVFSFDRVISPVVDWPYEDAIYQYGARFVLYLYNHYGEEKLIKYIDSIGSDFIPLMSVVRFKEIYGKDLKQLWKEWINYEKTNFLDNKQEENGNISIINPEGHLLSFTKNENKFYISVSSYKYDNAIYQYDKNKLKKIKKVYSRNIKYYNNLLFFTKFNRYRDDFIYSDLYFYDLNKNISKRLTFNKRVNSFDIKNNKLVFTTHSADGSSIFLANFVNNKIKNETKLELSNDIYFIEKIELNEKGTDLIFNARMTDNSIAIFTYNLENNLIRRLNIEGIKPVWFSENEILFISKDMDKIYRYNLTKNKTYEIYQSNSCILNLGCYNNEIYYVEYRYNGNELYLLKNKIEKESFLEKNKDDKIKEELDIKNYNIKDYTPLSYLEPFVWFYLPATLDSQFYLDKSISFPFIGPQFSIMNFTPENRFSYTLSIIYDYVKRYPNNYISLSLRLPYFTISYNWRNWLGGYKVFYDNKWYSSNSLPVCFSNTLGLYLPLSLNDYGDLQINSSITYSFINYNNFLTFFESFTYYYITPSLRASRWDNGFLFSLDFFLSPEKILDNSSYYFINSYIQFRIPIKKSFFYFNLQSGIELSQQNVFKVDSNIVNIEGIGSSGSSFIDTKAFSSMINGLAITGFFFASLDTGFDITIYKRTHYLHFLTLCFKELYFKIYNEFVYILNSNNFKQNILFDLVFQINIDLSLIYGYLPLNLAIGGAIGYLIGDNKPSWGIFFYLSSAVNFNDIIGERKRLNFSTN